MYGEKRDTAKEACVQKYGVRQTSTILLRLTF